MVTIVTRNTRSCLIGTFVGVCFTFAFVAFTGTSYDDGISAGGGGRALPPSSSCVRDGGGGNKLPSPAGNRRGLKLTDGNNSPDAAGSSSGVAAAANNRSAVLPGDAATAIDGAEDDDDDGDGLFFFDAKRGMADRTRKYASHPFVKSASEWEALVDSYPVCLATQTSVDRMYWLLNVSESWTGPISASIFVPDVEFGLAKAAVNFLRRCSTAVRDRVSFHFVSDAAHPPKDLVGGDEDGSQLSCAAVHASLARFVDANRPPAMMAWRESMIYPQQLLRNVARQGCPSPHVMLVDVDMVPKPGLAAELRTFLAGEQARRCGDRCAYVVPVYEVADEAGALPGNKTELLRLVAAKKARPFHKVLASRNSGSSKLEVWERLALKPGGLRLAYEVQKFALQYEPIYVARAAVPPFDERFEGFGCTRWTQAYEMLVSGFKFFLLDKPFLSHWGFQVLKTRPKWRAKQQQANNVRLEQYAKEFVAKYGVDPLNLTDYAKKAKRFVIAYGH